MQVYWSTVDVVLKQSSLKLLYVLVTKQEKSCKFHWGNQTQSKTSDDKIEKSKLTNFNVKKNHYLSFV